MKNKLLIATTNQGKLKEFEHYLSEYFELLSLNDVDFKSEIIEDGSTFADNALIKARTLFQHCGIAVLSDDSGLEVLALGGAPGIYSARYAGPGLGDAANNAKLLQELEPFADRSARFYCALAYVDSDGQEFVFEGEVRGEIRKQASGAQGFGYDPLFAPLGDGRTFAEMTTAEKKSMSHRGEALKKFVEFLPTTLAK